MPIKGAPSNDPGRPFDAFSELQRPGLLLLDGSVYAAFGGHCTLQPYTGYVAGVNTLTRGLTMWADQAGPTYSGESGIWQSGSGLMSDGQGRIFLTTGNGTAPAPNRGDKPPLDLGDSVVRLGMQPNGTLDAVEFFSPANAPYLGTNDTDLGSGGPVGLPFGSTTYPHLLVQSGKDGRVFLLNRDSLGGREQGPNGTDDVVSVSGPYAPRGQWGHPAVFGNTATLTPSNQAKSQDYVYYLDKNDYLRVLRLGLELRGYAGAVRRGQHHRLIPGQLRFTGRHLGRGHPVERSRMGGLVQRGAGRIPRDPAGRACTRTAPCHLSPIWSAPIGTAAQFTIPATNAGRVFVGTSDGHVLAFGTSGTVSRGEVSAAGPGHRRRSGGGDQAPAVSHIKPGTAHSPDNPAGHGRAPSATWPSRPAGRAGQVGCSAVSDREDLLRLIKDKAVVHGDFVLSSGQRATWYIDLRRVLLSGRGRRTGRPGDARPHRGAGLRRGRRADAGRGPGFRRHAAHRERCGPVAGCFRCAERREVARPAAAHRGSGRRGAPGFGRGGHRQPPAIPC